MPILGIFSKKQRAQGDASSSAGLYDGQNGSDFDSTLSSPTAEYVTADKTVPSSPNGRQALQVQVPDYSQPAPSRKLRIPFRRKKSFNAGSPSSIRTTNTVNFLSAPRPTHVPRNSTGAVSEVDISEFRRLEPPPPKSAVFSAYGDPRSALSTRSLPSDRRGSDPNSPPPPLPTPSKRPSFFNWNKSSTNVIPKSPGFSLKRTKSRTEPPPDSFNLKSFRHISPSSPEPPPAVIPPSNPRPRGASGASEASQRISVAAFREAQAKRSLAGSPGPSSRAPSPHGGIPPLPTGRGSPAMRGKASASRSPPVTRNRPLKAGRMSSALDTSDSDEDESSEEEDSDERDGLSRRRTVTHRKTSSMGGDEKPRIARSELGHGSSSVLPPRSNSSLGMFTTDSRSNSGISSSSAAKYSSSPSSEFAKSGRTVSGAVAHYTMPTKKASSGSDSDDNAPLARLVPPRRPGSAMSHSSSATSLKGVPKPLIDIDDLTGPNRRPLESGRSEPFTPPSSDVFSPGSLLFSAGTVTTASPTSPATIIAQSPPPVTTSKSPPSHFRSPQPSPPPKSSSMSNLSLPSTAPLVRMSPMRKDTSSEEKKRDVLTERLARVAQNSSPISPPVTQTASSASSPAMKSAERPRIKSVDYNMADLAELLGDNIRLISRNGEEAQVDSDSDEDEEEEDDESEPPSPTRIAPIPIKQRTPAPSFSVTSRPRNQFTESGRPLSSSPTASPTKTVVSPRPRSTTLLTSPPASAAPRNPPKSSTMQPEVSPKTSPASALSIPPRQRSTTMVTRTSETQAIYQPMKPFATPRDSPASSTGDSSSGRAPFTPRDGSDIGSGSSGRKDEEDKWSGGATGLLSPGKHNKRRSVSFEQDAPLVTGKPKPDDESRRRDRRRNEAKAAIELGNVINGRGPIVDDDDDDQPINQAYAGRMNPLMPQMTGPMSMPMGFNPQAGWNGMNMSPWPQMPQMPQMQNQMLTPNHMMPPPADPNFLVAHQQAMMYAKQAYQMAVAQHAMAAAADEWERGSTMSFSGGGGSVYGGPASALPMMGSMNSPPFMGMGGNGWSTGSMIFPNTARSAYGGGGAQSEYGGGGGGGNGNGNWSSSRSVYGETFGDHKPSRPSPPAQQSGYFPPTPVQSSSSDPRANARNRTFSSPNPNRTTPPVRKAPPPSSWKVNGA